MVAIRADKPLITHRACASGQKETRLIGGFRTLFLLRFSPARLVGSQSLPDGFERALQV